MLNINKHLDLLGMEVEDRVTKFAGVCESVSFDLYGCVQAVVNPGKDKEQKLLDCRWFDVSRLKVTGKKPVMNRPEFEYDASPEAKSAIAEGRKGPACKPAR